MEKGLLSGEVAEQLARVLRAEQHFLACADQAMLVVKAQGALDMLDDEKLIADVSHYRAQVVSFISMANPEEKDFSITECENQLQQVQNIYDDVKKVLL